MGRVRSPREALENKGIRAFWTAVGCALVVCLLAASLAVVAEDAGATAPTPVASSTYFSHAAASPDGRWRAVLGQGSGNGWVIVLGDLQSDEWTEFDAPGPFDIGHFEVAVDNSGHVTVVHGTTETSSSKALTSYDWNSSTSSWTQASVGLGAGPVGLRYAEDGRLLLATRIGQVFERTSTSWSLAGSAAPGFVCEFDDCDVSTFGDWFYMVRGYTTDGQIQIYRHELGSTTVGSVAVERPASGYVLNTQIMRQGTSADDVVMTSWDPNGVLLVWRSEDAGAIWVPDGNGDLLPEVYDSPIQNRDDFVGAAVGSDGYLHVYWFEDVASGDRVVLHSTWSLDGTRSWSGWDELLTLEDGAGGGPAPRVLSAVPAGPPTGTVDALLTTSTDPADLFYLDTAGAALPATEATVVPRTDSLLAAGLNVTPDRIQPTTSPNRLYSAVSVLGDDGKLWVYRSEDRDGDTWQKIGGPRLDFAPNSSVAVDDFGTIWLAIQERTFFNWRILIYRYDGAQWYGPHRLEPVHALGSPQLLLRQDEVGAGQLVLGMGYTPHVSVSSDGVYFENSGVQAAYLDGVPATVGDEYWSMERTPHSTDPKQLQRFDLGDPEQAFVSQPLSEHAELVLPRRGYPDEIWLAGLSWNEIGLQRTLNGGASWSVMDAGSTPTLSGAEWHDVVPSQDGYLYAFGTRVISGVTEVYRSRRPMNPLWSSPFWSPPVLVGEINLPSASAVRASRSEGRLATGTPDVWVVATDSATGDRELHHFGSPVNLYSGELLTQLGDRDSEGYAEDPVATSTGNFHDTFADLPAHGGVYGLDVVRGYNSLDSTVGVMGVGWRAPFSQSVEMREGNVVWLTTADGRRVEYVPDGAGGWHQPREYSGVLSTQPDWSLRVSHPDGEVWDFDTAGRLESMSAWDGQTVTIARDGSGNPTTATSSLGPSLTFAYVTDRLTGITSSDGRAVAYGYDPAGNLSSFTDAGSDTTVYGLDAEGRVETITDAEGVVLVDNTYDTDGRVEEQATPGSTSTFTYDAEARTTTVELQPSGEAVIYHHDEFGRVVRITDPDGKFIEKDYDPSTGWMSSGVTRRGEETVLGVDAAGNPTSVIDPANGETTYTYDAYNRIETATTPTTGTTTFGYANTTDRIPSTITDELTHVTTQTVVDGLVTSVTDPDGVTVLYRYNALRQLVETEDEYANITTFGYDAAGRQNLVELPGGEQTLTEYDDAGRVIKVTAADLGETVTDYDNAGRVVKVTDPEGGETEYSYDTTTGLLATMTDPMDRVTTYAYDDYGQVERTTFHDDTYVETDHGILGRVDAERDELHRETLFGYDDDGALDSTEDPKGAVVDTEYDNFGRVEVEIDAADRETTYDYDDVTGQLEAVHAPGGTTTYTYDDLGRTETVTDPRTAVTTTVYTDAGRTDTVTTPLGVTDYDYDDAGRLWKVTAPGGLETVTEYDENGWVDTRISPGGLETSYTHDEVGRVLTETNDAGVTLTNTWTLRGELHTSTRSGEGTVEYSYNPDGTMAWVDDALDHRTTFGYDDRGRQITRTDPNNKVWTTAYNDAGEKISETDPLNRTTGYTYDDAGNLETVTDPTGRVLTNDWRDDGLLDSWSATDGTDTLAGSYSYDAAGRRASATIDGRTWTYAHNAAGDLAFTVDPDGRSLGYTYDTLGRRTSLRRADGSGVTYAYDTAGRVDTITPTETFADTFTAPGGDPDANKWSVNTNYGDALVDDNADRLELPATYGAATSMQGIAAPQTSDGDMTLTYEFDATSGSSNFRLHQRYINTSNSYWVELQPASTTGRIYRKASGTVTQLATFTVPSDTDPHRLRFQVAGSTVQAKVWDLGDPEPGTWNSTVTDTAVTGNGRPLIYYGYGGTGPANAVTVDDVVHTNPSAAPAALVDYSWNDDSQLTNETMVNGATRAWTWTDGELTQFAQANTPGLGNRTTTLTYNTAGRLATEATSGVTTSYDYDQAGQLLEADRSTGTDSTWAYDNLGRRTSQTVGSNTTTYSYDDAGQLTAATPSSGTATSFTYDDAGRRTADVTGSNTTTYTYDLLGRLAELELPNSDTQERGYNPDNALDTLTNDIGSDTIIEQLDWDTTSGLAELVTIAEHNTTTDANTATSLARANPAAPWATSQSGRYTRDLPSDHLGSTIPTSIATIGRATSYTAWGEPASGTNTLTPHLGYRGELALGDQLHLRARDYQPAVGQFTTTDPLPGVTGTPTLSAPYHYADNTPFSAADPSGLRPTDGPPYFGAKSSRLNFDIPKWTGVGRWVVQFFIAGRHDGAIVGPEGRGDGRGFDPYASPDDSRAHMELDFSSGKGWVQTSPTCYWPTDGAEDCLDARKWSTGWNAGIYLGNDNGLVTSEHEREGSSYFKLGITARDPITRFAPAITFCMTFANHHDGSFSTSIQHESYPSIGVYRFNRSRLDSTALESEEGGLGLISLFAFKCDATIIEM